MTIITTTTTTAVVDGLSLLETPDNAMPSSRAALKADESSVTLINGLMMTLMNPIGSFASSMDGRVSHSQRECMLMASMSYISYLQPSSVASQ